MIENYLKKIDDLIFTADEISDIEITRRTVWDTNLEKIGIYRYKIFFNDGSFLELTERLVEKEGIMTTTKYRFHWQNNKGVILKRWDNAKHHPEIDTFPHHLHDGSEENVVGHEAITGIDVIKKIIKEIIGAVPPGKLLK